MLPYSQDFANFSIFYKKNDGKIEKLFKVLSTNMSLNPGTPPHSRVLSFKPSENGVQTPHDGVDLSSEMRSVLESPPALESVSPYFDLDVATVFLNSLFLGLLVKIAGVEATLLLIELEFTGSSLVDHFIFWKEKYIQIDLKGGCTFYRSLTAMFLFDCAFITVRKNDRDDFLVTYQTFDNPKHSGNPLNGAFPREGSDPEDESRNFVELLLFCSPMTFKDARDKSYTFAQLKVYIDPQKSFLFFVFTLLSFDDEEIDDRELDDDRNFEMMKIELSFPIRFCESISSPIVFDGENYIASFTIKIGNEPYNVRLHFGAFEYFSVDHRDRHYSLSAIRDKNTRTTFFCGETDAEDWMKLGMPRVGIFSIEIPEFVAPELTPLPKDLRTFLTSITWHNPEAAGSTESN
jgi:hypothetical protein